MTTSSIAAASSTPPITSPVGPGSMATANGSSAPRTSTGSATLDREAFLKLLVAQLKYQDPSKPMDASEMVSQSAQLSVVDKLSEISTSLSDARAASRLSLAGSVIGKTVTYTATDGTTSTAVVSGVGFDGDSTMLRAGNQTIPIGSVRSIAAAAS